MNNALVLLMGFFDKLKREKKDLSEVVVDNISNETNRINDLIEEFLKKPDNKKYIKTISKIDLLTYTKANLYRKQFGFFAQKKYSDELRDQYINESIKYVCVTFEKQQMASFRLNSTYSDNRDTAYYTELLNAMNESIDELSQIYNERFSNYKRIR